MSTRIIFDLKTSNTIYNFGNTTSFTAMLIDITHSELAYTIKFNVNPSNNSVASSQPIEIPNTTNGNNYDLFFSNYQYDSKGNLFIVTNFPFMEISDAMKLSTDPLNSGGYLLTYINNNKNNISYTATLQYIATNNAFVLNSDNTSFKIIMKKQQHNPPNDKINIYFETVTNCPFYC